MNKKRFLVLLLVAALLMNSFGCAFAEEVCTHPNKYIDMSNAVEHVWYCPDCENIIREDHIWENGKCTACDYECTNHEFYMGACMYCGLACTHNAVYEAEDNVSHHAICTICGMQVDYGSHFYLDGECTVCNYKCTHDFTVCDIDTYYHANTCTICGLVDYDTRADHTWVNGQCTACGMECTHNGKTILREIGNGTHAIVCAICSQNVDIVMHDYMNGVCMDCGHVCTHNFDNGICQYCLTICGHPSYNTGKCTVCGMACTHSNMQVTGSDKNGHSLYCPDCRAMVPSEEHTFDDDHKCIICGYECGHDVFTMSSLNGSQHGGVCDVCGYVEPESVGDHYWEDGVCVVCNYECEHSICIDGECQICGFVCTDHKWQNGECTVCGTVCNHGETKVYFMDDYGHTKGCAICGLMQPTMKHTYGDDYKCTVCGYGCEEHTWGSDYKCTACGYECPHTAVKNVFVDPTYHKIVCADCGKLIEEGVKHTYEEGVCTECECKCGHSYSSETGKCTICGMQCPHSSFGGSVCNICGWTCTHETTYVRAQNPWIHIVNCKTCGYIFNETQENHIWGDDYKCTVCGTSCSHYQSIENGVCTMCGWECGHESTEIVSNDDSTHNVVCTKCNMIVEENVPHTYEKGVCTECLHMCEHSNENCVEIQEDDADHMIECADCGAFFGEGVHNYEDGECVDCGHKCPHTTHNQDGICPVCNAQVEHTYQVVKLDYINAHGLVCSVCGKDGGTEPHQYADGVCELCGMVCTHSYNLYVEQVNPTATEYGVSAHYECEFCHTDYIPGKILPPTNYEDRYDELCEEIEAYYEELGLADKYSIVTDAESIEYDTEKTYAENMEALEKAFADAKAAMDDIVDELADSFAALDELAEKIDNATILKAFNSTPASMKGELRESFCYYVFSEGYTEAAALEKMLSVYTPIANDCAQANRVDAAADGSEDSEILQIMEDYYIEVIMDIYNGADTHEYQDFTELTDETIAKINAILKPTVASAAFANGAVAAKAVTLTVVTSTNAESVSLCDESKAVIKSWTTGYTDAGDKRTWTLSYTFGDMGTKKLYVKAGKGDLYSELYPVNVTVADTAAAVKSVKFGVTTWAGSPATITVTTGTNATALTMRAENKGLVQSWTTGYTDKDGVRTWNVSYTFGKAGDRTLYFEATNRSGKVGEQYKAVISVLDRTIVNTVWFDGDVTVGAAEHFTVTTSTNTAKLTLRAENKAAVKSWTTGYTDKNGVREWEIDYTFGSAGNRVLYFDGANKKGEYGEALQVEVTVKKQPTVKSVAFGAKCVVGEAVTITVKTTTDAKKLTMYSENKTSAVKTWTTGYTDANGVRTWKVSYTFKGEGNRTLYFAVSNGSVYGKQLSASVIVSKAAVKDAVFSVKTTKVGDAVQITVNTSTNAKKLALCAENGHICSSWDAEGNSKVVGDQRVWTVTYKFAGAGNRNIGFKASENGKTWGETISVKITVSK